MSERIVRLLLFILLMAPASARAQIVGPAFTFVDGNTIFADEFNTNFTMIYDSALNRFGGTMAGHLTFAPAATFDILDARDLTLARNATIGGTLGVTGVVTAPSFVGSGLSLTGVARLASTETITGAWLHTANLSLSSTATLFATGTGTAGAIQIRPNAGSAGYLMWTEDAVADRWALGIDPADGTLRLRIGTKSGTVATSWSSSGGLVHAGAVAFSGEQSVTTAVGANSITLGAGVVGLRITTVSGGSNQITALSGGAAGRQVSICHVSSTGGTLDVSGSGFGSSTSSIPVQACVDYRYDATLARWLPKKHTV